MTTLEHGDTNLDPAAIGTWARLRELTTRIRELTDEAEQLKQQLRDHLGAGEYRVAGKPMFTITPQRRFDPARAEQLLTAEQLQACQKTILDRDAVQKTVAPDLYSAMQVEQGKPVVRPA